MFDPEKQQALLQQIVDLIAPFLPPEWEELNIEAKVSGDEWEIALTTVDTAGRETPVMGGDNFMEMLQDLTQAFVLLRAVYGTGQNAWKEFKMKLSADGQFSSSVVYPD